MNENVATISLGKVMGASEGWGRAQGRDVYQKLIAAVEKRPGVTVFRISVDGVRRVDISFASETVVELARRYRGVKGICLANVEDPDMLENWEAASQRKKQPIMVWNGAVAKVIGGEPSEGTRGALAFAMKRPMTKAAELAEALGISITNASTKYKHLWERGYLLRREETSASGGIEFTYYRIG